MEKKVFYSAQEVQKMFFPEFTVAWVRTMMKSGQIASVKFGGAVFVPGEWVEQQIEKFAPAELKAKAVI